MTRETKIITGGKRGEEQINPIPGGQEVRPHVQVFMEFLAEADKRAGIGQTRVREIMRRRNGRPGATTLHAKCSDPMSDCR